MIVEVKTYKLTCDGCKETQIVIDDCSWREYREVVKANGWRRLSIPTKDTMIYAISWEYVGDYCPKCNDKADAVYSEAHKKVYGGK